MTDHQRIDVDTLLRTGDMTSRVMLEAGIGLATVYFTIGWALWKDWLTALGMHPSPSATAHREDA